MSNNAYDGLVAEAKRAALEVLLHNAHGPHRGLPRTAGWGYPEPYTRDWMISALGILASGNEELIAVVRQVLLVAGQNQAAGGGIPGLIDDPADQGSSDTTPLFLIALALYRSVTGETGFLEEAAQRALVWMRYQSPDDTIMVAQQPTSDWRDEQWVLGFGLYVNTLVHTYLHLYRRHEQAQALRTLINRRDLRVHWGYHVEHEGLAVPGQPYYALWSYKDLNDERFDLLGNSLAILSGIASQAQAQALVGWIEAESEGLRAAGQLALDLPPCLFPYVQPGDPDWHARYAIFNNPGEYHNGGIWPFVCGFYVAALVAAGQQSLAEEKLAALTRLIRPARQAPVAFGFNEWFRAQDGTPRGEDWQAWSAAMYLYAAIAVERQQTPFLDAVRATAWAPAG